MSDPKPDPRELPNFDAFRTAVRDGQPSREAVLAWADKMEEWAKCAAAEVDKLDKAIEEERVRMEGYEREIAEARNAADELEALEEKILDLERGLITQDELQLAIRS